MEGHQQQRYRVLERLASGGMAEVFLAESAGIEGFKKQVAIKRVLPALSEKKRFIAMFLDEARLSAHLSHSNVAQVFDIGVGDNAYFIVMEYVDGADLKQIIEFMKKSNRSFAVETACFIASKICEGLTYAHELRATDGQPLHIIHRDMSPPNVLITKHGEVKIVDFGLAKATSQLEKSEAGIIKGKFGYLSPEAAQGKEFDLRTDIFAVGIILWEMLSGRRLFYGETDFATVKQVQEAKIPSLRAENPAVPAELERILARALAREPTARYPSARDLGRDLTGFLFKFGRPVTSYDVAEVVRAAVALRKKSQPDKSSIIDKLIEEALLEFTSLEDKGAPAARPGEGREEPLKLAFEDIGNWAAELGPVSRKPFPSAAFEEGNLAALEETDPRMKPLPLPLEELMPAVAGHDAGPAPPAGRDGGPAPRTGHGGGPAAPTPGPLEPTIAALAKAAAPAGGPPKAAAESAALAAPPPAKRGSTVVVALLVAIAVAAGIWVGLHLK
jgi:serine/threonine-protein kinase